VFFRFLIVWQYQSNGSNVYFIRVIWEKFDFLDQ